MLEGPILLALLVFAIELARLREHTLNARRRGRAAKELACHLGKNRQAVLLTILSFPPGQHIQVDVFLDRQREVLIKLVFVDLEARASPRRSRRVYSTVPVPANIRISDDPRYPKTF